MPQPGTNQYFRTASRAAGNPFASEVMLPAARAASGQDAAAPPTSVINSRRLMTSLPVGRDYLTTAAESGIRHARIRMPAPTLTTLDRGSRSTRMLKTKPSGKSKEREGPQRFLRSREYPVQPRPSCCRSSQLEVFARPRLYRLDIAASQSSWRIDTGFRREDVFRQFVAAIRRATSRVSRRF